MTAGAREGEGLTRCVPRRGSAGRPVLEAGSGVSARGLALNLDAEGGLQELAGAGVGIPVAIRQAVNI